MLQRLAESGRLGDFCVWPCPPGVDPVRNVLRPQVMVRAADTGEQREVAPWVAYRQRRVVRSLPSGA